MGPRVFLRRYLFDGDTLRLMGWTLLTKPIGLVTQMLIARLFGAGQQYDAYALVLFLVTVLNNLVGQSFNAVFLPLAIRCKAAMPRREFLSFQNLALAVFIAPLLLYLIILLFRGDWIVGLIAPNLPTETRAYVDRMIPWMVVPGLALMVAYMLKSVLNQNRRFQVAGAMPCLVGLVTLAALVSMHKYIGIWALPVGFAAGNLAQLLVLTVYAFKNGYVAWARPVAPPGGERELRALGGVFVLSQLVMTVGTAVDRYFATGLEVGSVSSLAYSNSILNMGLLLFSFSLTVVMFTRISEYVASGDMKACQAYLHDNLTRQSRLVVPISLGLAIASSDIVRVLFQRGEFGLSDTVRTSGVLAFHMLGLPAMVTNNLIGRVYYSMQKVWARVWLNLQYVATLILLSYLLVQPLKVMGLAVAVAITININLALNLFVLHRFRTGLSVGPLAMVLVRCYVFAGVSFGIYIISGAASFFDSITAQGSLMAAIFSGMLRAGFICTSFYSIYYGWRKLARRRGLRG